MQNWTSSHGRVVEALGWAVVLASLGLYALEAWTLASAIFGSGRG